MKYVYELIHTNLSIHRRNSCEGRIARFFDIQAAAMWMLSSYSASCFWVSHRLFFSLSVCKQNECESIALLGSLIDRICLSRTGICNENTERKRQARDICVSKGADLRYLWRKNHATGTRSPSGQAKALSISRM